MNKLKPFAIGIAMGLVALAIYNRVPAVKKLIGG